MKSKLILTVIHAIALTFPSLAKAASFPLSFSQCCWTPKCFSKSRS
jgi:hypothetical protein